MLNQKLNTSRLATNDVPIDETQLINEIMPLIKDYFVGDIQFDGNQIVYVMPNGQKFLITAKTI